jgi:hypothetical protein
MKNALGVSLGITALIWTYLALNVIPGVLVWAGFIAWQKNITFCFSNSRFHFF